MTTVGALLRTAREQAGLTQQNVADRLFVSRSLIATWETGRREMRMSQLLAYCDVIGASITVNLKEAS